MGKWRLCTPTVAELIQEEKEHRRGRQNIITALRPATTFCSQCSAPEFCITYRPGYTSDYVIFKSLETGRVQTSDTNISALLFVPFCIREISTIPRLTYLCEKNKESFSAHCFLVRPLQIYKQDCQKEI